MHTKIAHESVADEKCIPKCQSATFQAVENAIYHTQLSMVRNIPLAKFRSHVSAVFPPRNLLAGHEIAKSL